MPVLAAALFLGFCLGHLILMVRLHNVVYGTVLSRRWGHLLRYLIGLATFAVPAAVWYVHGWDLTDLLPPRGDTVPSLLLGTYVLACLVTALLVLPGLTLWRLLRPPPAALTSNHTRTVDVAAELGYRPVGRGKLRHMACLPGNEVFQVDFSERTLHLSRLPAEWDGLTILHLSDLHLCGTPDRDFFRHVMDRCNEWQPDLVALTGDVVDSKRHHRWVVPVLGRLRWGVAAFAILGNHDWWHDAPLVRRRLRRVGMRVLGNGWERLEVRGRPLVVIGHEGPWFPPGPDLSGCPADGFRLCLSHTPDHLPWARQHGIDLMLAGHVHGGQIRLPLVGSVFVPSRYGRRYDCGTFYEAPTLLHVSRGLGGEEPLRYNCRPEVTKLILRPGPLAA
jgi:predicted MPP superfamily phosphohydrolase